MASYSKNRIAAALYENSGTSPKNLNGGAAFSQLQHSHEFDAGGGATGADLARRQRGVDTQGGL